MIEDLTWESLLRLVDRSTGLQTANESQWGDASGSRDGGVWNVSVRIVEGRAAVCAPSLPLSMPLYFPSGRFWRKQSGPPQTVPFPFQVPLFCGSGPSCLASIAPPSNTPISVPPSRLESALIRRRRQICLISQYSISHPRKLPTLCHCHGYCCEVRNNCSSCWGPGAAKCAECANQEHVSATGNPGPGHRLP